MAEFLLWVILPVAVDQVDPRIVIYYLTTKEGMCSESEVKWILDKDKTERLDHFVWFVEDCGYYPDVRIPLFLATKGINLCIADEINHMRWLHQIWLDKISKRR